MLNDHFDHGGLVLCANSLHYNCVNRESYPYNWDVVWPETTIHRTRCDHDNHYTTNAACQAMTTSSRWHIQQDNQRNLIKIIIWRPSFALQTNEWSIRLQNRISTCGTHLNISTKRVSIFSVMFDVAISHNHRIGLFFVCVLRPVCAPCNHWPLCLMPVMMVAGLYNFITSLGKLIYGLATHFLLQYQEYVSLAWVSLVCFRLEQ